MGYGPRNKERWWKPARTLLIISIFLFLEVPSTCTKLSQRTMCDESCARGGGRTRRSYSHSSSSLESRSRFRSTSVTTLSPARGSGYRGSRNRSRVRRGPSSRPEASAGGDRSVHQALCGGIVVRSRKHFTDTYRTESTRHFLNFERRPNFCILFCIYEKSKRSLWKLTV